MGYKILGINLGHNSSVCVLNDGEIVFFLEEERLSREKHDPLPINLLKEISINFDINQIVFSGLEGHTQNHPYQKSIKFFLKEFFSKTTVNSLLIYHHLCHSSISFFNSGFSKALSVIIDGEGNCDISHKTKNSPVSENETLQLISYPFNYQNIYKGYSTHYPFKLDKNLYGYDLVGISKTYESITNYLGWKWDESGKTMGLSSYGSFNKNIPSFYKNFRGNPQTIKLNSILCGDLNLKDNPQLKLTKDPKEWHYDPLKITDLEKDIAYKIQQESQQIVGNLIEKGLKETGLKQVCCAGGYFLNCVTNYYLKKRFPDIEFYFEPIASDAGLSIGAAKLFWHEKTQDKTIRPQKTLYYGPKYSKEKILKGIKKYLD